MAESSHHFDVLIKVGLKNLVLGNLARGFLRSNPEEDKKRGKSPFTFGVVTVFTPNRVR